MTEKADVIAQFRSDMSDPPLPSASDTSDSLWTDTDITRYMSLSQDDFARATFCFTDSKTFKPAVTAGEPLIKQDQRIIKPKNAYLQSTGQGLDITTALDMDEGHVTRDYGLRTVKDWRLAEGVPRYLVTDDETGYFRLAPIPQADDVVQVHAYRIPLESLVDGGDLTIPEEYRLRLINGMRARAYRKDDSDVYDPGLANQYEAMWRQELLEFKSNFKVSRRGSRTVRYGGIPNSSIAGGWGAGYS